MPRLECCYTVTLAFIGDAHQASHFTPDHSHNMGARNTGKCCDTSSACASATMAGDNSRWPARKSQQLMATLTKQTTRLQPIGQRIATMKAGSWRTDKQTSAQRGYGYKWQQARAAYLSANPLCVYCQREGKTTAADVVDHIKPHQGDQSLFWQRSNWQSLCRLHHDTVKAQDEGRHKPRASFDADGRVAW